MVRFSVFHAANLAQVLTLRHPAGDSRRFGEHWNTDPKTMSTAISLKHNSLDPEHKSPYTWTQYDKNDSQPACGMLRY